MMSKKTKYLIFVACYLCLLLLVWFCFSGKYSQDNPSLDEVKAAYVCESRGGINKQFIHLFTCNNGEEFNLSYQTVVLPEHLWVNQSANET